MAGGALDARVLAAQVEAARDREVVERHVAEVERGVALGAVGGESEPLMVHQRRRHVVAHVTGRALAIGGRKGAAEVVGVAALARRLEVRALEREVRRVHQAGRELLKRLRGVAGDARPRRGAEVHVEVARRAVVGPLHAVDSEDQVPVAGGAGGVLVAALEREACRAVIEPERLAEGRPDLGRVARRASERLGQGAVGIRLRLLTRGASRPDEGGEREEQRSRGRAGAHVAPPWQSTQSAPSGV